MPPENRRKRATWDPAARSRYRRRVALEIFLPLALGWGALAGVFWMLAGSGMAGRRAWADAALVFLIAPWLGVALLALIPLALAIFAVTWLALRLPGWTAPVKHAVRRAERAVDRGAGWAVRPVLLLAPLWAAARAGMRSLGSIVRRR